MSGVSLKNVRNAESALPINGMTQNRKKGTQTATFALRIFAAISMVTDAARRLAI